MRLSGSSPAHLFGFFGFLAFLGPLGARASVNVKRHRSLAAHVKRIDLILGASLAVALAGSAIGVVTYEDDRVAGLAVTWATRDARVEAPAASVTGAGDAEIAVDVAQANITQAAWTVTVSGSAARVQPVAIRVEIVVPRTNETLTAEAELPAGPTASVDIPLAVDLAPVPDADRVSAPSVESARVALNATLSSSLGIGPWTIRVSLAPTAPGPLGAETFTIAAGATLTYYEADVTPETPGGTRG